ncbi:MAG TPA: 50S ribosomal protein L11 methyltransferase [Conexibacter sp.]|nr:50S ribosomal protein L11 methyltransferase [Conexibacter sp.]
MIRLALRVDRAHAEVALAELLELAPGGVEEVDRGDVVEYAVYGPSGELPALPDLEAAVGGALVEISTTELPDDWSERWKQFHHPLALGDRLAVRPPWEQPIGAETEIVIDPAQAFGTGAHATTRLCLELLLELAEPAGAALGSRGAAGAASGPLLDLGCGSGVLAIAAAKLGFDPVLAVDIDPLSVDATQANAVVNGVALDVARCDLRSDEVPAAPTVLANLLRPLLLDYARVLSAQAVASPRTLIASGLLVHEADEIALAFAPHGLREHHRREQGEWAALLLTQQA